MLCAVKYIREVSPLFKKSSVSTDLPWDGCLQSPNLSSSDESPKSSVSRDRKIIPLKMSFISRNLTIPDLENRFVCVCVCDISEVTRSSILLPRMTVSFCYEDNSNIWI